MVYERRPLPGNHAHVISITLLFLVLMGGGFYGLLSALETGDGRWLALMLTCVFGIFVAAWRVKQHDARAFSERERLPVAPIAQEPQEPITEFRVFSKPSFNSNLTAVGKFSFSRGQWEALKTAIAQSGYKVVRDPIRAASVFPIAEIKKNWAGIVGEFKRLGLIDDDQVLTPFGHQFFFDYDPFERDIDPPTPTAVNGRTPSPLAGAGGGGR